MERTLNSILSHTDVPTWARPRAANREELEEILAYLGSDRSDLSADVHEPGRCGPGWVAYVSDRKLDQHFWTTSWPTRESLVSDLRSAGVGAIYDEDGATPVNE